MKTITMSRPSIVQMEEDHLRQLTKEVKETVAVDLLQSSKAKRKKFGAVDLWRCRKMCRTANIVIR
jgi:hypothetical protein